MRSLVWLAVLAWLAIGPAAAQAPEDPIAEAQALLNRLSGFDARLQTLQRSAAPKPVTSPPPYDLRSEIAADRDAIADYLEIARQILDEIRGSVERKEAAPIQADLKRLRILVEAGERLVRRADRIASPPR